PSTAAQSRRQSASGARRGRHLLDLHTVGQADDLLDPRAPALELRNPQFDRRDLGLVYFYVGTRPLGPPLCLGDVLLPDSSGDSLIETAVTSDEAQWYLPLRLGPRKLRSLDLDLQPELLDLVGELIIEIFEHGNCEQDFAARL